MDAYVRLARGQTGKKITVAALCREANMNRGTFYLHYQDCDDFLDAMEHRITKEIDEVIDRYHRSRFDVSTTEALERLFTYFLDNAEVVFTVLERKGGSSVSIFPSSGHAEMIHTWQKESDLSSEQLALLFAYVADGTVALLRQWWRSGFAVEKERVKELFDGIVKYGLYNYIYTV